ncbi:MULTISPECIES: flagellar hook-associated protein 2 [unclassified Sutcliffiella]|uniref:flagellar hook-associated protein 2 n=1 Tax=unclassified Sutcliffiella TaxID=2837532 RepID=UPI0030CBF9A3
MRLTGFQSGLDINQMVADLMKAQRMPMNKLTQQKQLLEWKRDDYRETNRLLNDFRNLSFDMTLQRTYSQKQVTSSNDKVTATASSTAANVTYTISDVKVATPASIHSKEILNGTGEKFDPSKSIMDQRDKFSTPPAILGDGEEHSFTITTFDADGNEIQDTFKINQTSTMNDLMNKISTSKIGVTAFFDEVNGQLMLTRKNAGNLVGAEGKAFNFDGDFLTDTLNLGGSPEEVMGTDAKLKINGVETTRKSNTFSVNGVTFTLHGDMEGDSAVVAVRNDTDKTFNAIKDYITKYNELIEKINGKIGEPVYRDYKPLSDQEREALSEKQIEQWEEKARSGLLRNDSILSSGLNKMRLSLYEKVGGVTGSFSQLSEIGIATGANYRDKGKLLIDEDKLRAAIENDSNSVMELFTANGTGIARKLRESATATVQSIEARAGNTSRTAQQFTIGRELMNVDKRISDFEKRMQTVEARYWRQFTAMEKAIGQSNQQSMQLMSQFYNG